VTRPELAETEKAKPYAEYYHKPPAVIPETVREDLLNRSHAPEDALPFENINDLLLPGYLSLENGHCRLPNGSFFVAVRTEFIHATSDMLNWWFDWHPQDSLRYRIWYPESHFAVRMERNQEPAPNHLPHWYTTHYPVEDIGLGKEELTIRFVPPAEFGFDTSCFHEAHIETVICGFVGSVTRNIRQHTCMCHLVRRFSGGLEMRSRFWIGNRILFPHFIGSAVVERIVNTKTVRRFLLPSKTGMAMAMHCAQEYNNLAQILPELYQAYH
jgi:hypothetical protein